MPILNIRPQRYRAAISALRHNNIPLHHRVKSIHNRVQIYKMRVFPGILVSRKFCRVQPLSMNKNIKALLDIIPCRIRPVAERLLPGYRKYSNIQQIAHCPGQALITAVLRKTRYFFPGRTNIFLNPAVGEPSGKYLRPNIRDPGNNFVRYQILGAVTRHTLGRGRRLRRLTGCSRTRGRSAGGAFPHQSCWARICGYRSFYRRTNISNNKNYFSFLRPHVNPGITADKNSRAPRV